MKVGRLFFAAMLVFVLIVLPQMVYTSGYFALTEDVIYWSPTKLLPEFDRGAGRVIEELF